MKQYDSFYFLHVVKTGGRFFLNNIINPIETVLEKNNIKILKPQLLEIENTTRRNRHLGWIPEINDSTYVVSFFREPVSWTCSWFTHINHLRNKSLDITNQATVIKNIESNSFELFKWLEKETNFYNYQSKNYILGVADQKQSSINSEIDIFHNNNKQIDKNLLLDRLERVNLLLRQDDLKNIDYNLLLNKIFSDLGIESDYRVEDNLDKNYYSNDASRVLYKSLDLFDKQRIQDLMSLDMEIYNNNNLFWSTK